MRFWCLGVLASFGMLLAGCGDGESGNEGEPSELVLPDDGLPASCHPFRTAGACAAPFPASHFLEDDPDTPTGKRVALVSDALPEGFDSNEAETVPFDPSRWNEFDGFSWATPIVAYFDEKIDVESLPSQDDFTESLRPDSATLVVDLETGELEPHFSEVDLSANIEDSERQPIMIRNARHLRPNRRYGVAITRSIRTREGGTPSIGRGFESALGGATTEDPIYRRSVEGLADVVSALEAVGVERDDLLLAWDFKTNSVESVTTSLLTMRDRALEMAGDRGLGYRIDSVEMNPSSNIHKRVRGVFTVPSFLEHDDRTLAPNSLVRGDDQLPDVRGTGEYPFDLMIPNSVLDGEPFELIYYGHGLLGSALDGFSGTLRTFCHTRRYVCIGTDLIGLSSTEDVGVGGNNAAVFAIEDVNKLWWLSDRLQQGQINRMVLVRTARALLEDPQTFAEPDGGTPFQTTVDPLVVKYFGISQGAIFGTTLVALSPDIQRGVFQVGGSGFSFFVQRSVNWRAFFPRIRSGYPDRLHQQVVLALWQPALDVAEGSGVAWNQGVHEPLPGTTKKDLLFQVAVGDSQVPNLGADTQARTLGLPNIVPTAREVWGLETTMGGDSFAISYWDLEREPPPKSNATPLEDNDVHGDIRKLEENMNQTDTFLRTGRAEHTCSGPCSFPGF